MRTVLFCGLLGAALYLGAANPATAQVKPKAEPISPASDSLAIRGLVTDVSTGVGIPGATVLLKGTTTGVSTDAKGGFRLVLPSAKGKHILQISSVGYVTREMPVRPGQTVAVGLAADTKTLNEVVVTGAAPVQQRREVTGAVATQSKARVMIRGNNSMPSVSTPYYPYDQARRPRENRESYEHVAENGFQLVGKAPLSTFSIDVDAASYSNVRRFLLQDGQLPPPDAVRTEELVNYFRYNYPPPTDASAPCTLTLEQAPCPWAPQHQLVLVGLQARTVPTDKLPPANLVFLIDVSGSMASADKLPLVKASLKQLVRELRPQDKVSMVVYAGAAGLVLPPTPGSQRADILAALDNLEAGGSTAGGAGLRLAYATARQNFLKEGNNRVILATDGDFNVGESSDDAMEHLIKQERESGVFLSVLAVGTGNLQDSKMERLADKGNGNYAYIDNLAEGRRVLVQQFGGTLFTLAKDVKLQVEFNPARVQAYRLIGYENRLLADEDFNNDKKDAGELGAGQQVTALYEVVPVGAPPVVDGLKYQSVAPAPAGAAAAELLTVKLRYKEPQGQQSRLVSQALGAADAKNITEGSENLRWAAAVAQMSLLLRQSERRGLATWDNTLQLARAARGRDDDGYRAECIRMMETAAGLAPTKEVYGSR
ncbi:vWA domain-containing protein [Hymenobacter latericus]|uniref:vWA domain-containing protein n=1 Tax=Hymenobacter sp. YIM 151858-1 TaxID=2987688 RepID=UPI002225E251|nr:von Willebrand factor type A domain-containing protein [Hymenobacter sp. YIM 151858-1]UYZ58305.1 von Willebrand factor type A domain-containing protein [Hymenobacter sp. YIM 151858-1]